MNQVQIDPETQKRLNEPLINPKGLSAENEQFLNMLVSKVDSGEIKLMQPSSLINHKIYDQLSPEKQGKVDFDSLNLLSTIRNIYELWKYYKMPTFQIQNLAQQVRLTKERLEEISGDVYII